MIRQITDAERLVRSEAAKRAYREKPGFYEKICEQNKERAIKAYREKPGYYERICELLKGYPRRKGTRKPHSEEAKRRMKEACSTVESRKRRSESAKKRCTPEYRAAFGKVVKERWASDPERLKRKIKEGQQLSGTVQNWSDPITRELLLLEYYVKHPDTWYGSVTYPSRRWYERHKYCHKFDDSLKERVRAFFNYQCAECNTPQNGKGLDVHHVNEKKDACCNHEVKRLFVPLCPYCHGLIQRDRAYWKEHYTALINEYYGGKCYFTKDEYREWYAMP